MARDAVWHSWYTLNCQQSKTYGSYDDPKTEGHKNTYRLVKPLLAQKGMNMGKKKNNRNDILNSTGKEIYSLTRLFSPLADKFIQEKTIEINEYGFPVKPTPPFEGYLYYLDFKDSRYKRIMEGIRGLAVALCQHKKIRTFLANSTCIFIVSPLSSDEIRKEIHAAYGMTVICLYEMDKAQNKIDPDTEILARYMMRGLGCDNLE